MPYVAPEVLRGKPHTQAADIYSFGIISYEVLTGLPPYPERDYDAHLALDICEGLRPNLKKIAVPQLLKDLISKCWNEKSEQRPSADEIYNSLDNWCNEINNKKDTEFADQIKKSEELNETLSEEVKFPTNWTSLSKNFTSKLLPTKEINDYYETKQLNLKVDLLQLNLEEKNNASSDDNKGSEVDKQTEYQIPPK